MYEKILVPLDGSELSEAVLSDVVTIAKGCQIPEVVLLRVREPLDKSIKEVLDPEIAIELDQAYEDEASVYLEKIAKTLEEKGVDARTEVMEGDPAEEIIKYSKDKAVDLIVMSTHGRSGFSRIVFGSVAEKVIKQSEVPVLIKPAGRDNTK